jgi:hypothetical protein
LAVVNEFGHQAGFANTGLAGDQDHATLAGHSLIQTGSQDGQFSFTAYKRQL